MKQKVRKKAFFFIDWRKKDPEPTAGGSNNGNDSNSIKFGWIDARESRANMVVVSFKSKKEILPVGEASLPSLFSSPLPSSVGVGAILIEREPARRASVGKKRIYYARRIVVE
jgi:hypothetical protein